ncbi:uncharacterized protein HMPREF1541_06485 [Cyphellophora europaea CBS 101466]|uniref:Heterokaryon incompatibility domain-containing protein n=1 Tax=Cyphellophora europaea (strain CBS 101466) TaxID=1220924 RepID=W2RQ72_CYPE1|nr:uncharacterized protein HMPREF1541_06485 [Cyphellophora europaea CBS 101466]ETN38450.1 hypothetical protein HMPREF1541_06485 [Cyphellophora europaea CBS 101466]
MGWECKIDSLTFSRAASRCNSLAMIENVKKVNVGPLGLFHLLNIAHSKEATNAVDYVYGIHSLATGNGLTLPMPDYRKSVEQIFIETARHCIDTEGKLTILAMVDGKAEPPLPSCAPKFPTSSEQPIMGDYSVSSDSKSSYRFDDSGLRLTVKGVFLDSVQSCGRAVPYRRGVLSPRFDALKNDFQGTVKSVVLDWLGRVVEKFEADANDAVDKLLWTMSLDEPTSDNQEPAMFDLGNFKYYFFRDAESLSAKDQRQANFMVEILGTRLNGRRLVLTESGSMGLGPEACEPGDSVVLIAGMRMPFIVRKAGLYWRLVGWAFVYGIMYGRSWRGDEGLDDIELV